MNFNSFAEVLGNVLAVVSDRKNFTLGTPDPLAFTSGFEGDDLEKFSFDYTSLMEDYNGNHRIWLYSQDENVNSGWAFGPSVKYMVRPGDQVSVSVGCQEWDGENGQTASLLVLGIERNSRFN